ncbi:FCD domain-containing protein [Bacillus sp. V3B]|uniref:FCD domain-containing protein n=1 Tax=Bacillus sp. V3B TaxID=2804915 RepID=UPI0035C68F25|nr:FCD domain-containing protein [Bacillus sp. V3B]
MIDQEGSGWELQKSDENFHHIIFQANQRKMMWKSITQLATHYNRLMMLSQIEHNFADQITHHKNIISIIENKESNQTESILKTIFWN